MLGFAARAGRIIFGTDTVCRSLGTDGDRAVRLVLVANDASDTTKRKLAYKCEYYGKPLMILDIDGGELGERLGKSYQAMVIAINDKGFADEIIKRASEMKVSAGDQSTQVKGSFPKGNR